MGDIWDGFDFPTLDPVNPVNSNINQAIDATPAIDSIDAMLVKRAMVVFFIIDISGSMKGARIGAVNDAIRNLLPELKKREASNTNAEIRVAIMEFSSSANWRTLTPQPVSTFIYDDITYVSGGTNFGNAFNALNEKLSRNAFLSAAAGAYTPLIILLTDGKPSDIALYPEALNNLKKNSWFRYATKAGIAIEEGALSPECKKVLLEFTGNESMVLEAKNTNILSRQIELVTLTGVDFVTQQGSLQNIDLIKHGNQTSANNQVSADNQMNRQAYQQPAAAIQNSQMYNAGVVLNPNHQMNQYDAMQNQNTGNNQGYYQVGMSNQNNQIYNQAGMVNQNNQIYNQAGMSNQNNQIYNQAGMVNQNNQIYNQAGMVNQNNQIYNQVGVQNQNNQEYSQNAAQNQMYTQPIVDVRAGENPVIPGMDDIDWDDFPVFN